MEVAKRFLKFLSDFDDPLFQEQHAGPEVQEYFQKIRNKLNLIEISSLNPQESTAGLPLSEYSSSLIQLINLSRLNLFEDSLISTCFQAYEDLKKTIDQLCLLHVYLSNFRLDSFTVTKFLKVYCQAVFGSANISIISEEFKVPYYLRLIHGEQCRDGQFYKEIIDQIKDFMGKDIIKTLDLEELPALSHILEDYPEYLGNIAIKFKDNCTPFYIILHFNQESPFSEYFASGNHHKQYPLILNFIKTIVNVVSIKSFNHRKEYILQSLKNLEIELIQLKRNYIISFVASEVQEALCCEVPTSLTIIEDEDQDEIEAQKLETKRKSIGIVLLKHSRLEIRANFAWNNARLNNELSTIWTKLGNLSKVLEERSYYRNHFKTSNNLFLQFSTKGDLIYQSGNILEEYSEILEIGDILLDPHSRSMEIVLGKDKKFLTIIQEALKEFRDDKYPIATRTREYDFIKFNIICKRNEWSKEIEGFCLAFTEQSVNKIVSKTFEDLIMESPKKDRGKKRFKTTVSKMKLFIGHQQPVQDYELSPLFVENMELLNKVKGTIVSEYLPEEFTLHDTQSNNQNQITAVRKFKIEMTPKTAFRTLGRSNSASAGAAGVLKNIAGCALNVKPEKFTKELLQADRKDDELLNSWTIDFGSIEDWTEKSRLVWVILKEMNLMAEYRIDSKKLCEFVSQIRDGYNYYNNAYHNYDHGVSVMHSTYFIMKQLSSGQMSTKFSNLVNLALLLAAFCHDVNHTGRTNVFEVNSGSDLATLYHDRAVLEQHHAAYTFKILKKDSCNIFANLKADDYKELRKLMISNILATDMKEHFDFMKDFRQLNDRVKQAKDDHLSFSADDIKLIGGAIIHCADLSGATKDFSVAYAWSEKVNQEFSSQVQKEEELGIPVTPYFKDLDKRHIMAKQEIAFISFMVKPLWELFNEFCLKSMDVATNNIDKNLKEWNVILEKALKEVEEAKPVEETKPAEEAK